jgi:hypothetical protein
VLVKPRSLSGPALTQLALVLNCASAVNHQVLAPRGVTKSLKALIFMGTVG